MWEIGRIQMDRRTEKKGKKNRWKMNGEMKKRYGGCSAWGERQENAEGLP